MRIIQHSSMAIAALIMLAGCAPWQPGDETAPPPEPLQEVLLEAALDAEDLGIICEDTDIVGSRITRVVCTTAEQREEAEVMGRQLVERIQTDALSSPFR